jgi:hypothetical protein
MDVSGVAALRIQANALDSVRSVLAQARGASAQPAVQADVILSLSTAASALLVGHPK